MNMQDVLNRIKKKHLSFKRKIWSTAYIKYVESAGQIFIYDKVGLDIYRASSMDLLADDWEVIRNDKR